MPLRLPGPSRIPAAGPPLPVDRAARGRVPGLLLALLLSACTEPLYDGWLELPGLGQQVRVVRDEHAMPYIYAPDLETAIFAQGFVMAQDRMFQLELIRHLASGRVAELGGAGLLEQDRLFRTVGMRRIAEGLLPRLKPGPRRVFSAFGRGIDAFLKAQRGNLPAEYAVLGIEPEPWTLLDSVTVFVFINWNFSANLGEEVLSLRLIDHLGPELAQELFPVHEDLGPGLTAPSPPGAGRGARGSSIPPRKTGLGGDPLLARLARPVTNWALGGSNAWATAGSRSARGAPILASDPHGSGNMIPVPFYPQALILPAQRVVGISILGLPGVLTGRNDSMAWGFTNDNADHQDLFVETLHPQDPGLFLEGGEWLPFVERTEVLRVRQDDGTLAEETLLVRETPRGPIVTELLPGAQSALSFRWYVRGLLDGNLGLDQMMLAQSPEQLVAALALWPGITQNAHYAHKDGRVGWHVMGHVPLRRGHGGLYPVPAELAAEIWDGVSFVPPEHMPHVHDPPLGWTASANHWGYGPDYPYLLATSNAGPYRVLRIAEVLDAAEAMSEQDHRALQLDTVSVLARRLLPLFLEDLEGDPDAALLARRLRDWDGSVDTGSAPAAMWNALMRHVLLETFTDELGSELTAAYLEQPYYVQARFELLAQDARSSWFDDVRTPAIEGRADIVRRAAARATAELRERLGSDPDAWRWGLVHQLFFENPAATDEPLRSRLGAGPYPFPGDGDTLQRGAFSHAKPYDVTVNAAMRMVADLSDDCSVLGSVTTGVSGRFTSPHYRNQIDAYLSGEGLRWWLCDAEIEAHRKHELFLLPGQARPVAALWSRLLACLAIGGAAAWLRQARRYRKLWPWPR
jgi:penicillin G amidase